MRERTLLVSPRITAVLAILAAACASSSGGNQGTPSSGGGQDGSATSSSSGDDGGNGASPSSSGASSSGPGTSSGAGSTSGGAASSGSSSGASGGGTSSGASGSSGGSSGASDGGAGGSSTDASLAGWTLTWSDEFNGPNGTAVDPSKWTHDVGGTGWGNQEFEYYTNGSQNAVQQDGYLVVTATPQGASQYTCSYPSNGPCKYTSARLKTEGLFSQQYGRFEARAQMPTGKGLWPAIWMLGNDIGTVGWPKCGEIDFMETVGTDINRNHGTLHMPNNYGPSGTYSLPGGASYADGFHTFAIEWDPSSVKFFVDDNLYETQSSSVPSGDTWEFSGQPFFLIINVAVGGQWPGSPDSTSTFPQTLKVDWVRVYEKNG
ncbi:MAG: glycoside hydrolase family 16 protein [Polyangiaceae bacterium]